MARPRGQTLQQRFGFLDEDLKAPTHDEIMSWLTANIDQVIIELFWDSDWPVEERREVEQDARQIVQRTAEAMILSEWNAREEMARHLGLPGYYAADMAQKAQIDRTVPNLIRISQRKSAEYREGFGGLTWPQHPLPRVAKLIWEWPVKTDGKFMVGFVDLYAEVRQPRLALAGYTYVEGYAGAEGYRRAADPGQLRAVVSDHWDLKRVYFEVKATMPSAGELIRQIRMYQEYVQGQWVVVSPDDRHRGILESQGIEFYKASGR
jgi:hypothetical protein